MSRSKAITGDDHGGSEPLNERRKLRLIKSTFFFFATLDMLRLWISMPRYNGGDGGPTKVEMMLGCLFGDVLKKNLAKRREMFFE
jgi:hypothetical protein